MMYLDHFGLREAPFRITPHTEFFFAGGNRGSTLDALVYAITHDEGIVRAIIEMAHCLGLTVVAEGVESADILHRLQGFGCEFGQGFHWSPALPAEGFCALVRNHQDSAA